MTETPKLNRVVFKQQAHRGFQKGVNQIADAVRPTLGPLPRIVAVTKVKPHDQLPELLDSGGTIARRIIQLPDRDVDTGAMFIRQLLWQQHEQQGDGTATTAVLFQSVYNQSMKFIAAGGNSMMMRRYLEDGLHSILQELKKLTLPVEGQTTISQVAESVCGDAELAEVIGEIFDIVGVYGQVEIRSGRSRNVEREYVSGTYFESGLHNQLMVNDQENVRAQIEDSAIFLSDLEIKDVSEIVPVVQATAAAGLPGLVVICRSITDEAVGVLVRASQNPGRFKAMAVKTPGNTGTDQAAFLEDLGSLTGGKPYLRITGDSIQNVKVDDLGEVRRIWADKTFLSVYGGKGNPAEIRRHVAHLKGRYEQVEDKDIRSLTLTRLGKFMGGSATLFVGGMSEMDISDRKAKAERAISSIRSTLLHGVVPGGGAALLSVVPVVDEMAKNAKLLEKRASYQILSRALEEPTRTILANAGYDPEVLLDRVKKRGKGYGVDIRTGEITDMVAAGIFDSAGVLLEAVRGAISSAGLGITVDVMVHRKRQKIANRP